MANAKIAKLGPYVEELDEGTYYWCTCGESAMQPFCDGSHAGTEFTPMEFKITEKKKYGLCGCKQSKNQPFCDGFHNTLKKT